MAKSRPLLNNPAIRAAVRDQIRAGRLRDEIEADIGERFRRFPEADLRRIITQEQARQSATAKLLARDKRRNIDLRQILQCPAGTTRVRLSVRVSFEDTETGETKDFGEVSEVNPRGRLADIINTAIEAALARARARGYHPPQVTSANTSGTNRYTINYVECP